MYYIRRLFYKIITPFKFFDWPHILSILGFNVYKNDKQRLSFNEAMNLSDKAVEHFKQMYLKISEYKRLDFVSEGKYGWIFKYMTDVTDEQNFEFDVLVDKINGVRFILLGLMKEQYFINYYSKHRENIDVFYDKLIDFHIDLYPHPYDEPDFYKEFQID